MRFFVDLIIFIVVLLATIAVGCHIASTAGYAFNFYIIGFVNAIIVAYTACNFFRYLF